MEKSGESQNTKASDGGAVEMVVSLGLWIKLWGYWAVSFVTPVYEQARAAKKVQPIKVLASKPEDQSPIRGQSNQTHSLP